MRSPDSEALLSIGQTCEATGLSARTIRYYEELGLLPEVRRSAAGRRAYAPEEVERLRFIRRLKKLGLSLAEIKELSGIYAIAGSTHAMLVRLQELLDRQLSDVDGQVSDLIGLRDELNRYRGRIALKIEGRISS